MSYENNMNLVNQSYNNEKDNINELKEEEDEPVILERSLSDYINNPILSDAILKLNDIEFNFHKIVLISCSDYLNKYFTSLQNEQKEQNTQNEENNKQQNTSENKNKIIVNFPEIISSSFGGGNKKNCLEKIMKYCYSNQNFSSIEKDINQYNIFTMMELAHSLGIKSLKLNLEKKIIKNHLGRENATKLAIESKIFDLKKLNKKCIEYITHNFKDIKIFKNDIMDLDFDTFKNIMNSDEINIESEKDISEFILEYIKSRRDLPLEEEEIKPNENDNKENKVENNEENKENNEENKENNEENKENNEENNKNIEVNNEKEKEKEDENEKSKKYLYELKDSVKRKKLSKEQEKELIMCIRFSFLPHNELNKLINEPVMNDFKDILLQALSLKLNSYEENPSVENAFNSDNKFNSNPRLCFIDNNDDNNNNNEMINNNRSMPNLINENYNQNSFNENIPNNPMYKSEFNYRKYNPKNKYNYKNNSNQNIIEEEYKNNNIDNYNDYYDEEDDNVNYNNNDYDYNNQNEFNEEEDSSLNDNLNAEYFNINNPKEKEKRNRYYNMFKESKNKNKEIESNSSEEEIKSNYNIKRNYYPKFKYKKDFDENGALYYIGTRGLTRKYENPHNLKLIKAFGSSLLSGNFSDFVGRSLSNLSTENEENSFFGIDLGPNRNLIPTFYSIKNRDSNTNILLSWNFQGSNDKINFEILDKRTFYSETNEKYNEKTKRIRHELKKPKTTSTWGISKHIREKFPNGFRYFLLKQIGKNSSKNYFLTNSGFELYGEGIGSGWIFN